MIGQRTSDNGQRRRPLTWAFASVLCPLSFVLAALPASASVVINEVQSSNDETPVADDRGEAMDWAELHNNGGAAVDISGWGFSDKGKKDPFKWTFPEGTWIEAGGYLVVICDKTATSKTYPVASFGLGADGETLTLTDVNSVRVDEVEFGAIPTDCSFGRAEGGLRYFAKPTPGAANAAESYDAPVTEPVAFSQERGVFTGNKTLRVTLSHPNVAAKIYYTTDHSDPSPTNGREYAGEELVISKTTIVRATAVVPGALPCRNIASQSYIFLDQVKDQQKPSCAGDIWSDKHFCSGCNKVVSGNAAACPAEYGVSTTVLTSDATRQQFVEALQAGTVLSVTMSDKEMFDPDTGLHSHPSSLDIDRAASVEWVTGNHVFGTQCGVAMQGGWSRQFEVTPKKSFQLKFRARFGASKLEVPVLDDFGCTQDEFKSLILRGEDNNSWGRYSDKGNSMNDQFVRDLHGDMCGYQSHGTHVHLFINGLYWGLYNLCERIDSDWAATASGWGGDEADYDVVKHGLRKNDDGSAAEIPGMEVRDGTAEAYTNLIKFVQTLAKDGTITEAEYAEIAAKVDLDAYIDYIILEAFSGNGDWPNNNWIGALASRGSEPQPLRYIAWDVEDTVNSVTASRLGASADSDYLYTSEKIQRALEKSAEYKLRFADRVHRHFFGDGALTVNRMKARHAARAEVVRKMVFAEVARWGHYYADHNSSWSFNVHYANVSPGRYTKEFGMTDWEKEYNTVQTFLQNRWSANGGFLSQLQSKSLYPSLAAAEFASSDGKSATLSIPTGTGVKVYYTTDGSDPREAFTGKVLGTEYTKGLEIKATGDEPVKARARTSSGTWSALSEIRLEYVPPHNSFIPTTNGENWDQDDNWTQKKFPNAADAEALIGVPTEVKEDKGWRNIHIKATDISVGYLEFTNGGKTNRIDNSSPGGNLTLCETVAVADAGAAFIDLDAPHVVALGADVEANVVAEGGELVLKGALAGNGSNLKKSGHGCLTLACTNAADAAAIDKLQCDGGIVAVTKPLRVGSVTKSGTLWVRADGTDALDGLSRALVSDDAVKPNVGLFIPVDAPLGVWYGGVAAAGKELNPASVTVYLPDENGEVAFDGKRWSPVAVDDDVVSVVDVETDGFKGKTYRIALTEPPPDEPEEVHELSLAPGATTNVTFKFRKNLRYWLVGVAREGEAVEAALDVPTEETEKYPGYALRTTEKVNEMTVTIRALKPGMNEIYIGRQYKFKNPRLAARYRVRVE